MYHPLKVSQIERLTSKSVCLTLEIPDSLKDSFQFLAGQYLSLEETIEGENIRRSYSICSAPSEGKLQVGVKQIPNGRFSSFVNQQIGVGSILSAAVPEGRFVLDLVKEEKNYVGIAAGSGITPILSIAKEVLHTSSSSSFYLIYGNKSIEDEMFTAEINTLNLNFGERFTIIRTYSQKQENDAAFGRIGQLHLEQLVENGGLNAESFFLCGPGGMINTASAFLMEKGILDSKINHELFTASSKKTETAAVNGAFTMQLTCDDVTTNLEGAEGKTVLDVALQNKLDVPYSCQGGVCSSCIAKVTEGHARMTTNQILTNGEIAEGLILSCQAHPTTAHISVDFDDV